MLYGTTPLGGIYGTCASGGNGTIFRMSPTGVEKILHRFDCSDGAHPSAAPIYLNGTLYGTAGVGGKNFTGTAYSMTTGGVLKVLYNFPDEINGKYPGSLMSSKGAIYGTTHAGGIGCSAGRGCGVVFSLTP